MGASSKVLIGLRQISLIAALVVIGLGAWSKYVIHDVEVRGAAVLQRLQPETLTAQEWRDFFTAATNGTTRMWITMVAASLSFLTSLLVIFSTIARRLDMPGSVRVPLELLSTSAMITAFGCTLSFAYSMIEFVRMQLETADSADLTKFTMIIPLSRGIVVATGVGSFILLCTTITAMVQACMRARAKESCSFEPTASALGMGYEYQALVPPEMRSRPPTMYDPRKPLPKQLDGMPATEEEKDLAVGVAQPKRADSAMSASSIYSVDPEKDETWPLTGKSRKVPPIRPSRPWSEAQKKQKQGAGVHAM